MAIQVIGPSGNVQEVNAGKGSFVTLYDQFGVPINKADRGVVIPGTTPGQLIMGDDYKTARLTRSSPDGTLRVTQDTLVLYDSVEGAAVDTNKWIQTTTTMTIAQAAGVITFNSGNSVATTVGAMQTSHNFFPFVVRTPLVFRTRAKMTAHFNNNLIELGFGSPATATSASIVNGAIWRKDGLGQYVPVISINGSELLGTPISNATFLTFVGVNDYAMYEVVLEDTRAKFSIFTQAGVLVNEQYVEFASTATGFTATHLQAMHRTYNSAATGTAVQLLVSDTSVIGLDSTLGMDYETIQAGMSYGGPTSPTAYTQVANYANSAAPASAALSNTAAGYANIGGQFQFAAVAGAETDYALFALQIPSPYKFFFRGIKIQLWNNVVAVATTATVFQWGLAFNSSAVSLATGAPYTPMRLAIGTQQLAIGAAVGAMAAPDIEFHAQTGGICVFPGRFFHIILKMPVGTATATEIFRGTCAVDGYFA